MKGVNCADGSDETTFVDSQLFNQITSTSFWALFDKEVGLKIWVVHATSLEANFSHGILFRDALIILGVFAVVVVSPQAILSLNQEELLVFHLVKIVNRFNLHSNGNVLVEIHSIRPSSKWFFSEGDIAEVIVKLLFKHSVQV